MSVDKEKKILNGQVERVTRKMQKIMVEQLSIAKQIYKTDDRLDKANWALNQDDKTLSETAMTNVTKYQKFLDNLLEQKKKNNIKLHTEQVNLDVYKSKLEILNRYCTPVEVVQQQQ